MGVNWHQCYDDLSFQAIVGGYVLRTNRAEFNGDIWFWNVSFKGRQIPGGSGDSTGLAAGKSAAEAAFYMHLNPSAS